MGEQELVTHRRQNGRVKYVRTFERRETAAERVQRVTTCECAAYGSCFCINYINHFWNEGKKNVRRDEWWWWCFVEQLTTAAQSTIDIRQLICTTKCLLMLRVRVQIASNSILLSLFFILSCCRKKKLNCSTTVLKMSGHRYLNGNIAIHYYGVECHYIFPSWIGKEKRQRCRRRHQRMMANCLLGCHHSLSSFSG